MTRSGDCGLCAKAAESVKLGQRGIECNPRIGREAATIDGIDDTIHKTLVLACRLADQCGALHHVVSSLGAQMIGHRLIDQYGQQWQQNHHELNNNLTSE